MEKEKTPKEAQEIYDSVEALVKLTRFAYVRALAEGFTTKQSMEVALGYMYSMMNIPPRKR